MPPKSGDRQPRVLAVDDDPAIRELYAAHLEPLGCRVDAAGNGAEALAAIGKERYTLVLMDLAMPVMGGLEALERLRRDHPPERLPVVLVTGLSDPAARKRGHELGVSEYLTKPLDRHEFIARMKTLLAMRAAQAELEDRVAELERLNDLKDLMVNTVANDLRSPLATAKGFLELGLDALKGRDPVVAANVDQARALVIAAADMAADLADIPKLEEGRIVPNPEAVNIEKLASARLLTFEHVARSRNLQLVVRSVEDAALALADRRLLDRIVGNLFNHAIANCPNGSAIELVTEPFAGEARVMVSLQYEANDAVPSGMEKRLFDKPAQAEMMRNGLVRNAGMELTFCRLAVALMDGTMSVESNLLGRVAFAFSLPAAPSR